MLNPLLTGIRVLDLSRLLPGPFCSLYLAQMGAEVIKIEEPNGGDYARALSPDVFSLVNRGKKSVTLDLRKESDRSDFLDLVATADVVLESFRPGVMDRLGCGFDSVRERNPRIVYAALTGYGQTGPYRDRVGHDLNYRGYAGELEQNGRAGQAPSPGNFQVADLAGGALTCLAGILAALFGARASGVGTFVDASMLDGTLALQVLCLSTVRQMGEALPRGQDMLTGALPSYAVYECADGKHLAVGALEPKFFQALIKALDQPELARLPMAPGPKGEPLRKALVDVFKRKSRDEWEQQLAGVDACVSAVLSAAEALHNEHIVARELIDTLDGKPVVRFPLKFSNAITHDGVSPKLGADNAAVIGT